ncbi:uncharacterized protein METZ01_LOCUS337704, partial [marine metagenome]
WFLRRIHQQGSPGWGHHSAVLSQFPSPRSMRPLLRRWHRRTHWCAFRCSQKQLGGLDLHGCGHGRHLRTLLHHRTAPANLLCRPRPRVEGGGVGEPARRSLTCLYSRSRFSGIPRATHSRRHSGSPFAGLRAHRSGQGLVACQGHHKALPSWRSHSSRGLSRARLRRPHKRVLHRGDHLPSARHGPALRECRHHPRRVSPAGRLSLLRVSHRGNEPSRRHSHRSPRSPCAYCRSIRL